MDMSTKITTTEMHTGGEPVRIIEGGFPAVNGQTILGKIRFLRENLDDYRKLLMFEPRGHYDMYGVLLVPPDDNDADIGAIFMHNEGYSSMCGHAVISLGRYAVDRGMVKTLTTPETKVNFQCPCGLVEAFVRYDGNKSGEVRFHSVPSFLYAKDVSVSVPGYGNVVVDVTYGGAFYAVVPAERLGLDLHKSSVQELKDGAGAITATLKETFKVEHPESTDLAFIYGTILTDGNDAYSEDPTDNMCVFADKEVDRSPCGSGVTARIAQQYQRGLIKLNQSRKFRSPTKAMFTATPIKEVTYGERKAVVVEVSGNGYYTGSSTFTLEPGDAIGRGFLLDKINE